MSRLLFHSCRMCCCKDNEDKAFSEGKEVLNEELDLVRLVRGNRELHNYAKYLLKDK